MPNMLIKDLRAIAEGFPDEPARWPHIPCPGCRRGGLRPVEGSLVVEESERSQHVQGSDENWEPEWLYGAFHCVLRCGNSACPCDLIRVVEEMDLDMLEEDGHWTGGYWKRLTPRFFHPALPLIENDERCPEQVLDRVAAASRVLWVDPSSAANRLRSAAEALMDDQGIPRKSPSGKDLTLHSRIEKFKIVKPFHSDAADALLAVKWIGNVGSHDDSLKISNVLAGVQMLDFALTEIYETSRELLKNMAAEITARKGAPTRR